MNDLFPGKVVRLVSALTLDDINRADDRILRGCMQMLQNFELFSWHLPKRWQIVATANPEGGDYSVTPMDDAMLTRMLHTTLKFDSKIAEYEENMVIYIDKSMS